MTLGKKITEMRRTKKLTQEKLSEKIGVTRQTLANWESDITAPNIKEAQKLAKIFEITLDDLTDNKIEIECSKKTCLNKLVGKLCTIDIDTDDYRLDFNTPCKIIDIDADFIKIEFEYQKKSIIKMLDLKLISSITYLKEEKK